jgi:hypothetical protein
MLTCLDQLIAPRAKPGAILALLGLTVALGSLLVVVKSHLGDVPLPGGQLVYSSEQVYEALAASGGEGRRWFLLFQLLDLSFIPVYSLLFAATIRWAYRALAADRQRVAMLSVAPLLGALADSMENGCLLLVLAAYPRQLWLVATVAGAFTAAKWILVGGSVLIASVGLLGVAAQWARRRTAFVPGH